MFEPARIEPTRPELQWDHHHIRPGANYACRIAGPVVPVWVHWDDECNKPCKTKMTAGKLPCHWCSVHRKRRIVGYLPVYSCAGDKQEFVVLSKTVANEFQNLAHPTPIKLWRTEGKRDKLKWKVLLPPEVDPRATEQVLKRRPVDLREFLFILWGDSEFTRFFQPADANDEDDPSSLPVNTELVAQVLNGQLPPTIERKRKNKSA